MAKTKKKKKMPKKKAWNVQLRWKNDDDKSAIQALQRISRALGGTDGSETLRFVCVNCETEAKNKAKKIKEVLKAS